MSHHRRTARLAVAALAAFAAPVFIAAPASAVTDHVGPDFDGDGVTDLAIGARDGLQSASGTIIVDYSSGLDVDYLRPPAYGYDGFGDSFDTGDLDGDGYDDLVAGCVSCEWEWNGPTVSIFKGSAEGLAFDETVDLEIGSPSRAVAIGELTGEPGLDVASTRDGSSLMVTSNDGQRWNDESHPLDQASPDDGVPSIAVGDITGDGVVEVVIGTPGVERGGAITIVEGLATGSPSHVTYHGEDIDLAVARFGADVAIGDVDGDLVADVTVGAPGSIDRGGERCGLVVTLPSRTSPQLIGQESTGVPGVCEEGDEWGAQVEAVNLFGDAAAEIIVGAPGEAIYDDAAAGGIVVLHCDQYGVDCSGSFGITQLSPNVPGTPEPGDRFGAALRVQWPSNPPDRPGLLVGAPGEDVDSTIDAGWVLVATLDASGAPAAGSYSVTGVAYGKYLVGHSL